MGKKRKKEVPRLSDFVWGLGIQSDFDWRTNQRFVGDVMSAVEAAYRSNPHFDGEDIRDLIQPIWRKYRRMLEREPATVIELPKRNRRLRAT